MIKIAVAAALAAIVIADVSFVPASTSSGVATTPERPRGLKGDRLPVLAPSHSPSAGCAEAAWPHYPAECVGSRREPSGHTPSTRRVRSV